MPDSNFAELRRIRSEMSAQAGHNVRRFVELLDGVREKYRDRLVNHGAEAEPITAPQGIAIAAGPMNGDS